MFQNIFHLIAGTGLGTTVECGWEIIDISALNGSNSLAVPPTTTFYNTDFITIYFSTLGINNVIISSATSLNL